MKTAIKNTLTTIWVFAFIAMIVCAVCWIILSVITYGQKDVANMNTVKITLAYTTMVSLALVLLEVFITGPVKSFLEFHRAKMGQIKPASLTELVITVGSKDNSDERYVRMTVKVPKDIKLSMTDRSVVNLEFDQIGQIREVAINLFFMEGHLKSWNAYYSPDYHIGWVVIEVVPVVDFPSIVVVK